MRRAGRASNDCLKDFDFVSNIGIEGGTAFKPSHRIRAGSSSYNGSRFLTERLWAAKQRRCCMVQAEAQLSDRIRTHCSRYIHAGTLSSCQNHSRPGGSPCNTRSGPSAVLNRRASGADRKLIVRRRLRHGYNNKGAIFMLHVSRIHAFSPVGFSSPFTVHPFHIRHMARTPDRVP
jgi:hypothetical protein